MSCEESSLHTLEWLSSLGKGAGLVPAPLGDPGLCHCRLSGLGTASVPGLSRYGKNSKSHLFLGKPNPGELWDHQKPSPHELCCCWECWKQPKIENVWRDEELFVFVRELCFVELPALAPLLCSPQKLAHANPWCLQQIRHCISKITQTCLKMLLGVFHCPVRGANNKCSLAAVPALWLSNIFI